MMRSCRIPLSCAALITLLAVPASAFDSGNVNLPWCLEAALTSPHIYEMQEAAAEAAAIASEASARRLPSLGFGASYRYSSETMESEISLAPGLSRTLSFGDGRIADMNLSLALPLYTGGELSHTAQAAAAGSEAAALRVESAVLDLTLAVRRTFYIALGRRSQLDAAELAVTRMQRHADEVAGAVSVGAATEEMHLRAVTRLRESEQRRRRATAALDSACIVLGKLVQYPFVIRPAGDLAMTLLDTLGSGTPQTWHRADLKTLQAERFRQEHLAVAARGRLLPRVTGELAGHYGRPGVDQLANDWMGYATAAVSLEWPLWDGGARRARSVQAEARARQLEGRYQDLERTVNTNFRLASYEWTAIRDELVLATERADLTRRLGELVGARYERADASESEYLDALDDVTAAEFELSLVRTRQRLAEATLLWTLGR
ncbi:MAG: TolC family protein [Candidatus Latescibacteria bacterium]|nr:TolC family protein [Candidatus Latescibacterota bacterium]